MKAGRRSYEPNCIGENLAARGVVVVTIAYRVGPFGFFSPPALNNAGGELPYVFDRHDNWLPAEETDQALTGAILDYWAQFARTGNPNLVSRPEWPVHSRQDPAVMELGNRIGEMEAFSTELCKMLNPG